jgi:hypothetical protein
MSSAGKFLSFLRSDKTRGLEASRPVRAILRHIQEWSWPFKDEAPKPVPVHVLVGKHSWRPAAWMLASWVEFSEHSWPIVLHDDGTLPEEGPALFKKLFLQARVVSRPEADAALEKTLRAYPFCQGFRRNDPSALKLFDASHYTDGRHYLQFDPGLLFFNHPRDILHWVDETPSECWFLKDARERSLLTAADARDELEIKIWARVNSAISLIYKPAIDLDLCDRALAQTSLLRGNTGLVEQTLAMLCAARSGKGGLLPECYSVSETKMDSEDAVSRYYLGARRERCYAEGLKQVRDLLFPQEE